MKFFAVTLLLGIILAVPVSLSASRVVPFDCAAITKEPARRVYFYDAGADGRSLVDLKQRLLELGAYHVNIFTPSHIVCNLPESVSLSAVTRGTNFVAVEERGGEQMRAGDVDARIQWLRECYDLATRPVAMDRETMALMQEMDGGTGLRDSVDVLDPALVGRAAIERAAAGDAVFRRIDQNAEFMIGDIVVNLIIPESRYNMENWREVEKGKAIKGIAAALIRYQDLFPHAPMNFIVRTFEDVATYYEPSHTRFEDHGHWIRDIMAILGYNYATWEPPRILDKFNEDMLSYFRADWVFTIFVIRAMNMPNFRIKNADFTTYTMRGGPYMVLPYPTGPYAFFWEPAFVTTLHMEIDLAQIFWAMSENIYAQGFSCENRSGYLNFQNANKIEDYILGYIPVNHCIGLCVPCVMDSPAKAWHQIVCDWTAGQMGIVDWNKNDVPDIFDRPPVVDFVGGPAETLVVDTFTVRGTIKAVTTPNRNFKQDSTYWIDYACPLKDAVMDINGFGNIYLIPEDGRWDELEEEVVIPLTDLSVGETSVELYIRNTVGCKSPARVKRIFRAGLSYSLYQTQYTNGGIELSWYMVGETFNAAFDLYRIETVDGIPDTTLLAANLKPAGPAENQFLPYAFFDSDVIPSNTYWYFVRGTYYLRIQGGPLQKFVTTSKTFKGMAMIPIPPGEMISFASPNPFSTKTEFSVIVPKSYTGGSDDNEMAAGDVSTVASGLRREVPTELVVKVFDVMGRPIKTVVRKNYFGRTVLVSWDGTNDQQQPVPSGIYFLRATAGSESQVRKVTVLR